MKPMDCKNCIYGDVATKPRTIKTKTGVIHQNPGGITCRCKGIKSMSFTDGEMECSEFRKRER